MACFPLLTTRPRKSCTLLLSKPADCHAVLRNLSFGVARFSCVAHLTSFPRSRASLPRIISYTQPQSAPVRLWTHVYRSPPDYRSRLVALFSEKISDYIFISILQCSSFSFALAPSHPTAHLVVNAHNCALFLPAMKSSVTTLKHCHIRLVN